MNLRRLGLYNPIVGIYELKRFMGLSDLPKSDDRIARVLRYKRGEKWIVVNADVTHLKFGRTSGVHIRIVSLST